MIQQTEQRALLHGKPMSRTLKVYHAAALFIKNQFKMPIWAVYEVRGGDHNGKGQSVL